jgi:hypothetical protein
VLWIEWGRWGFFKDLENGGTNLEELILPFINK